MQEKTKCKKCGLLIDKDSSYCPYCGYKVIEDSDLLDNSEDTNEIKDDKENKEEKNNSQNSNYFTSFPSRILILKKNKNIFLFLIGFILIYLIQIVLNLFQYNNLYLLYFTSEGMAYLNFASYFVLFGIFLIVLNIDLKEIFKDLLNPKTYLYGLVYTLILIVVPTLVSTILNTIFSNNSVNNNQNTINSILDLFPFLSILVFGIIGPICEEFTYRLGLFTSLSKRANIVLTYIISAIIFGFIHFDYTSISNLDALKNELVNIPSYVISGLLLCYFYHRNGLSVSTLAHIGNNMFSLIINLLI